MSKNQPKNSYGSVNDPDNTIAFQGLAGAHSDMACRKTHPYMDTLPCASFDDVFAAVENGDVKYGLVPIENSQAGRVAEIHNILPTTKLHIIGEYFHKVEHQLLAPKGATIEGLEHVYSHPQALMQCRDNLKEIGIKERHQHADTAGAARDVAEWGDVTKAALASNLAAGLYGLEILKPHMNDAKDNTTLFVTIAREPIEVDPAKERVLTTLLFRVRNIPAALYKSLGGFATNGINLIKLESYISPLAPELAQFFITFEGHPSQPNVQLALEELGFYCRKVDVLGVYAADESRV